MTREPVKFGPRFLRTFGWLWIVCGTVSLLTLAAVPFVPHATFDHFDRASQGVGFLWIGWLQLILARYEEVS